MAGTGGGIERRWDTEVVWRDWLFGWSGPWPSSFHRWTAFYLHLGPLRITLEWASVLELSR